MLHVPLALFLLFTFVATVFLLVVGGAEFLEALHGILFSGALGLLGVVAIVFGLHLAYEEMGFGGLTAAIAVAIVVWRGVNFLLKSKDADPLGLIPPVPTSPPTTTVRPPPAEIASTTPNHPKVDGRDLGDDV